MDRMVNASLQVWGLGFLVENLAKTPKSVWPKSAMTGAVALPEGGLGLRSRLAPAAFWASWQIVCHVRAPEVCTQLLRELEGPPIQSTVCSGSPTRCRSACSRGHGGARVVQILGPSLSRPAARRSRGGRVDSWLAISRISYSRHPLCNKRFTSSETTFTAEEFRTLLLVRLHLPLHVDDRFCKCGARLDVFGHHRSACSRVGLLKPRGTPAEICAVMLALSGRGVARGRWDGKAIHEAQNDKRRR